MNADEKLMVAKLRSALEEEANKAGRAQAALEFMGLPDLGSPHFDAEVTHAAYRLGLLVPRAPKAGGGR